MANSKAANLFLKLPFPCVLILYRWRKSLDLEIFDSIKACWEIMCPPCLKMVTDINSWSRSWSPYPRTCSGWVDWSPILWTSCPNISSNGILKKVSMLAQHLPFRLFKNHRITKKYKRYSNFDCWVAHVMVPMSFSYQMIGCSRLREKILDLRIKARGDGFFFPTTAPFPRSGASYFSLSLFSRPPWKPGTGWPNDISKVRKWWKHCKREKSHYSLTIGVGYLEKTPTQPKRNWT